MKKVITILVAILYFSTFLLAKKYPDIHILIFFSGVFAGLAIVFFIYKTFSKKNKTY